MGYESRLYIVEKSSTSVFDNEKRWGEVIAMINMCKMGKDFVTAICNYPPTDCYIYNGDEKITEDCYGDPLLEIPVTDMISILEKLAEKEDYRRLKPAIGLLKGFVLREWDNLVVLHYGY